jgi:ELWxxDGT repeat protein
VRFLEKLLLAMCAGVWWFLPAVAAASDSRLVRDINTSAGSSGNPSNLVAAGGKVFFTASTPTTGTELWVSDGTNAGTRMVRDIWPGSRNLLPIT